MVGLRKQERDLLKKVMQKARETQISEWERCEYTPRPWEAARYPQELIIPKEKDKYSFIYKKEDFRIEVKKQVTNNYIEKGPREGRIRSSHIDHHSLFIEYKENSYNFKNGKCIQIYNLLNKKHKKHKKGETERKQKKEKKRKREVEQNQKRKYLEETNRKKNTLTSLESAISQ